MKFMLPSTMIPCRNASLNFAVMKILRMAFGMGNSCFHFHKWAPGYHISNTCNVFIYWMCKAQNVVQFILNRLTFSEKSQN